MILLLIWRWRKYLWILCLNTQEEDVEVHGRDERGMSGRIENTILEAIGIIPFDGGELSALPA